MAKTKALANREKTPAPQPEVERRPEAAERKAGSRRLAAHREFSPLPPPHGQPSSSRAAEVLGFSGRGLGAPGRAGMATAMQQTVGNARLGRMAGEAPLEPADDPSARERLARRESPEPAAETSLVAETSPATPPSAGPSGPEDRVAHQEIASAAAQPGVEVSTTEGGPVVLKPSHPPEPAGAQPPPVPEPPPPASAPPPAEGAAAAPPEDAGPAAVAAELPPGVEPGAGAGAEAPGEPQAPETTPPEEAVAGVEEGGALPAGPVVGADAGAALVPPPDPERLRAQIPVRELTPEEQRALVESGRTAAGDRAQVQQLLRGLRADAEREKASIQAVAAEQKARIATRAEARIAATQATIDTQSGELRSYFANCRSALTSHVDEQKAAAETQAGESITQLDTATATRIVELRAELAQRRSDLSAFAEQERRQPSAIAQRESQRASRELEAAAREAEAVGEAVAGRYPGGGSRAREKRAAARGVARDSAADIRAKKPAIAEELQSRTANCSGRYTQYAERVNGRIAEAEPVLIPTLNAAATRGADALRRSRTAALQALDTRLQVDLRALAAAETEAISRLQGAGARAIGQIRRGARQGAGEVDAAAAALAARIDNTVEETEAVVSEPQEPFVAGVVDVVEAARAGLRDTSAAGREQLAAAAANAGQLLSEVAASFAAQAPELAAAGRESADGVRQRAVAAIAQQLQARNEEARRILAGVGDEQQQLLAELLAEIDRAIEEARGKMRDVTGTFRAELRRATNQSLAEAKKPLTDPLPDRCQAAAGRAGRPWYVGLFQALADILIGLVILVVVTLVVAAIAAVFGVILTAWTAIMIAAAIMLTVGLIVSLVLRARQRELGGNPLKIFGLALIDMIGVTGIIQAFSGKDIVTGQVLSDAERTRGGVTGAFTLVMLALGVRALIKGPPGGVYTRPTNMPRGWGGWRQFFPRAAEGIRQVGLEMYTGLRQGVRNLVEWVKNRLRGRSKPLRSGAEMGKDPTAETIQEGTVRMKQHPDYPQAKSRVENLGFELQETPGDPHVAIREVVTPEGELIRVEKVLHYRRGMRYLDFEHEVGHIQQLTERFGSRPPSTERIVQRPTGQRVKAPDQQGILTQWMDKITEYHNRLVEFIRLYNRGASRTVLTEHARGVARHRALYLKKGIKKGLSPTRTQWAREHFPDITELEAQYNRIGGLNYEIYPD